MNRAHRAPTLRRGITLLELMVVIVLLSLVVGGIMSVLIKQQRFYTGTSEIIETKGSARSAIDILSSELRALSTATRGGAPNGVDIYALSDSSIVFRSPFGAAVVCTVDPTRTRVTVPPAQMASRNALTTFLAAPRAGDSLFVFDPGAQPGTNDDLWIRVALRADPGTGICPMAPAGLTATAVEEAAGISLELTQPLPPNVGIGSAIRFFRTTAYSLYQETDGSWYLGYSNCPGGACSQREPAAGPYVPYAAGGLGGLAFNYFDSTGVATLDPRAVARIDIMARAQSYSDIDVAHVRGKYADSLAVSIAVRNRI
jgi:type II secretory pathway pseudopilin PulG